MRILLFGKDGQLGWELAQALVSHGDVFAFGHPDIDLVETDSLVSLVRNVHPDVVVNAAAYTDVDRAESERERARKINARTPGILMEEMRRLDGLLIHYSTDYVFDGQKGQAYVESDLADPLNVYGLSKLEGERAIQAVGGHYLIFRTSSVYSLRQNAGFVNKVLQWSRRQEELRIVEDQISNPTWAATLAEATVQLLVEGKEHLAERSGLYHLACTGFASRFEWARLILDFDPAAHEQVAKMILPARSSDFPTPALRPLFSALDCSRFASAFGNTLPDWTDALRIAMTGHGSLSTIRDKDI